LNESTTFFHLAIFVYAGKSTVSTVSVSELDDSLSEKLLLSLELSLELVSVIVPSADMVSDAESDDSALEVDPLDDDALEVESFSMVVSCPPVTIWAIDVSDDCSLAADAASDAVLLCELVSISTAPSVPLDTNVWDNCSLVADSDDDAVLVCELVSTSTAEPVPLDTDVWETCFSLVAD
jgi:hypothetical protein